MEEKQEEPENLTVVIVKKGDSLAGLVVDNLIGQQEISMKSGSVDELTEGLKNAIVSL